MVMLLLIPLLPFLGFLVNAFFARRLTKSQSGALACGALIASFAVSLAAVWNLVGHEPASRLIVQPTFDWIRSGDLDVGFTLALDPLSAVMILVVTGIGSLIHIYSTAYMHEESDAGYARYFSYLNLFAAFMLVLVLGANFLVLFVGWEGVGLCSYLLIGFWFEKKSASDAGKKAFIVNRIGDFGFILGVLLTFTRFGTLDFHDIARAAASLSPETTFGTISLITLLLFVGATGKSAQIPLYVWLPDAMEGPTPVSALIHAATMVTAGVYMIGRNAELYSHAPHTLQIVAVIGAATALMAGTIGLVQNDIKRVLAYSTVSQLGYMFLAMGVGAFAGGIFHLYTHAFFKALMFLGSGAVIHALHGEQDIRKMGGLKAGLPITYWTFLIGALAIAGVPFLSGFFSKDEILYRTFAGGHTILWVIGAATSLLTAVYMFRLVFLTFHGERAAAGHGHDAHGGGHGHGHDDHGHGGHLHDAPPAMAAALLILAVGSVVAGYVGVPHALGGTNRIESFLESSFHPASAESASHHSATAGTPASAGAAAHGLPAEAVGEHAAEAGGEHAAAGDESLELTLMGVSSAIAILGIGIAAYFFLMNRALADSVAASFSAVHRTLLNKYWIDELYDAVIVQPVKWASDHVLWKVIDVWIIDGIVNGVGVFVRGSAALIRMVQTGSIRTYAASLVLGVVLILGYYLMQ
jgi:NADH-quinone oxidoreductase subunit L